MREVFGFDANSLDPLSDISGFPSLRPDKEEGASALVRYSRVSDDSGKQLSTRSPVATTSSMTAEDLAGAACRCVKVVDGRADHRH